MEPIILPLPKRINITDNVVQEYLANGTLVHIHGNKYTKYKNEIMQSIFVIEMRPEDVSSNLMKIELKTRSIVVVKSIRHEKDRSDKKIANKVIVGRLIRTVIEGRRQGADFHLPRDWEEVEDWIPLRRPPFRPFIMLVNPSIENYDQIRDRIKRHKNEAENVEPSHF